jgi:RHS repeat-associated protein
VIEDTIKDDAAVAQTRFYAYNDAGQLAQTTDRNGRVTKYEHDILDRLKFERWFDNSADTGANATLAWAYDELGRVLSGSQQTDTGALVYGETFLYDNLGRVVEQNNWNTAARANPRVRQSYKYDIVDNADTTSPIKTKYTQAIEDNPGTALSPDAVVTYSYDRLGRMRKLVDEQFTADAVSNTNHVDGKTLSFDYDDAGRMTSTQRISGTFWFDTAYEYDGTGRLDTLTHRKINNQTTPFVKYDLDYDNASRVVNRRTTYDAPSNYGVTNAVRDESYQFYDSGELRRRITAGGDEFFDYDANGNRKLVNTTSSTTGKNNRVFNDGTFTYVYDDEGNLKNRTRIVDGYFTEYAWDHRNRLIEVKERASAIATTTLLQITYIYDTSDLRVGKTVRVNQGGNLVLQDSETYVYDGNQLALTLDRGFTSNAPNDVGYLQNRYLNGPGIDSLLTDEDFGGRDEPGIGAPNLRWAANDQQGSVREVLDQSHAILEHRDFDSYGNLTALSGAPPSLEALDTVFGFAGREIDNKTGLYYNRARWYDAKLGKFISADPIGFAGGDANFYRYAGNDPVNSSDPTGLEEFRPRPGDMAMMWSGRQLATNLQSGGGSSASFSFSVGSGMGGVGFDAGDVASDIAAAKAQRSSEARTSLLSAWAADHGQGNSGSSDSFGRPPLLSRLFAGTGSPPVPTAALSQPRRDRLGPWSGYFKDNSQYYQKQGGFLNGVLTAANGTLSGMSAVVDTVPGAIRQANADARDQISRTVAKSNDPIQRFMGSYVAIPLGHVGEGFSQFGNTMAIAAPVVATGAVFPTVGTVLVSPYFVGPMSGIGLVNSGADAYQNYNNGTLSGSDAFFVGASVAGLRYLYSKYTSNGPVPTIIEEMVLSERSPITLYHHGELPNGVSANRTLSTSPVPELSHYEPGGQLYRFEVPYDVYQNWRFNGSIQTLNDLHAPTGIIVPEVRIMPPATGQMNDFLAPR